MDGKQQQTWEALDRRRDVLRSDVSQKTREVGELRNTAWNVLKFRALVDDEPAEAGEAPKACRDCLQRFEYLQAQGLDLGHLVKTAWQGCDVIEAAQRQHRDSLETGAEPTGESTAAVESQQEALEGREGREPHLKSRVQLGASQAERPDGLTNEIRPSS